VPICREAQQYTFLDFIDKIILWTMILYGTAIICKSYFDPIKFVLNIPSNLDLE